MLGRLGRRLKALLLGHACGRCGRRPAKLVIDATPAGKKLDGRTGQVIKTYAVRRCEFLCPACREADRAAGRPG
jgi:hypothetical protein